MASNSCVYRYLCKNVSINLVFRAGRNILTSTESGYCQTFASPFLLSKCLTFEQNRHYFTALLFYSIISVFRAISHLVKDGL